MAPTLLRNNRNGLPCEQSQDSKPRKTVAELVKELIMALFILVLQLMGFLCAKSVHSVSLLF